MKLRVVTWNVRRAKSNSSAWRVISQLDPDILLLQEVIGIPDYIKPTYSVYRKKAVFKTGKPQVFSTAILVKGGSINALELKSEFEWVNRELEFFQGNLLSCEVNIAGFSPIKVVAVYSPAWPVDKERLRNIDVSDVKLQQNPNVWCTEILWSALRSSGIQETENWIVAGDFNSSVTFDYLWPGGPRGNQEIIDRMNNIGLSECLFTSTGKLVPTFRNPKGGKVIHQLDHIYVSDKMLPAMENSFAGDTLQIFENSISDHLPVIADFHFPE